MCSGSPIDPCIFKYNMVSSQPTRLKAWEKEWHAMKFWWCLFCRTWIHVYHFRNNVQNRVTNSSEKSISSIFKCKKSSSRSKIAESRLEIPMDQLMDQSRMRSFRLQKMSRKEQRCRTRLYIVRNAKLPVRYIPRFDKGTFQQHPWNGEISDRMGHFAHYPNTQKGFHLRP